MNGLINGFVQKDQTKFLMNILTKMELLLILELDKVSANLEMRSSENNL
jgi:hypothetical protein